MSHSRWIRLLFGREFPFEQQLVLWDTIFAFDPTLDLIDLVCVSMLLRIRWTCKSPLLQGSWRNAELYQCLRRITQMRCSYYSSIPPLNHHMGLTHLSMMPFT